MAEEKIIGLTPGYTTAPNYVALKWGTKPYGFSISGSTGELISEETLDAIHDEWRENVDVEEEFGYMADESNVPDDQRKDWLESMLDSFEWPEPMELNYDLGGPYDVKGKDYYGTFSSAGQVGDEVKQINVPLIPEKDIAFIMDTWEKYHMKKEVPQKVLDRMQRIYDGIDNERQVRAAIAVGLVPEGKKQTRFSSGPGSGWHHESARHGLAAKGIKTGRKR